MSVPGWNFQQRSHGDLRPPITLVRVDKAVFGPEFGVAIAESRLAALWLVEGEGSDDVKLQVLQRAVHHLYARKYAGRFPLGASGRGKCIDLPVLKIGGHGIVGSKSLAGPSRVSSSESKE